MSILTRSYRKEINKVIDYIYAHLEQPLKLENLAALTSLSTWHFHRVFSATQGESVARFILRTRMERAAAWLLGDIDRPVSDIAYALGFSSLTVFCRNFKKYYGMTAERYRIEKRQQDRKNSQSGSTIDPSCRTYNRYFCPEKKIISGGKEMNCTFEIKNLPAFPIIYCRHQGALDQMQEAFASLLRWAYPRGLVGAPEMKLLSVYHNDPRMTEVDKLMADAAMVVGCEMKTDGEIGSYTIEGGRYAVGRFEIAMDEFPDAWNAMFQLLDEHGCTCADGTYFEIYQNNRDEHPQRKFVVDICIPVALL